MKQLKLLFSALAFITFSMHVSASHLADNLLVSARLNGVQSVPMVTTNAVGVASLMLNNSRDTICLSIGLTGLSGPVTGIHIHQGAPGISGPVVIDLMPFLMGNKVEARLSGADVSPENLAKLLSGQFYVNVHTAANPNGEIRGQLNVETDWSFTANLMGANEVPAVATNAYGLGVFNLSKDGAKIQYTVIAQDLSGAITGAHLHFGGFGVNGPVEVNLTPNVNGRVISGVILNPTQSLLDSLMARKVYLNVHTMANTGGEIRAQLTNTSKYLYFDANLNGAQQVPVLSTNAMGVASLKLNTTLDTLWYDVVTDGLSGPIVAAHFHEEVVGVNGSVVFNVTPDINGNRIKGFIADADLTEDLINDFLSGAIYLNVHTLLNPGGEIRGQVYRLAREGYKMNLDGMQQVPTAITTTATGAGMVSIDRGQSNAHYMIVIDDILPTAAHFHANVAGENGSVVFDLSSSFVNNGAFGYWNSASAMPFTTANSVQFRNDSIYVNVHTTANANGEIRGQALRGFQCSASSIGLEEETLAHTLKLNLYPNPVQEQLNVAVKATTDKAAEVKIYNFLGKEVYAQQATFVKGQNNFTIQVADFESGFYFISIVDTAGNSIQKFVKE